MGPRSLCQRTSNERNIWGQEEELDLMGQRFLAEKTVQTHTIFIKGHELSGKYGLKKVLKY